jgi:diguanylate cyclase (GGDEF)-like protein
MERPSRMKDPFKTRKMQTFPLSPEPAVPPAAGEVARPVPSQPPSAGPRPSSPLSSASSDSGSWHSGAAATERNTDPVVALPPQLAFGGTKDRATLTVLTGISAGQVYALDGTEHYIGRGSDTDIWIEDGGVSRRHARVTCRSDGKYFIEDLGSTNGTFVAAQRVTVCEIRPGDRIQIGPHVSIRFQIVDDAEEELQRRLYESSTRDPLTRIYNRKYFSERMMAEVAYSRRHRVKLAVLLLDLDDFKATNDTYGHLAGDMVLRLVSAQMQRLIRLEDLLARYGGEEFVILARATGKTDAVRLAERIRESISQLDVLVAPGQSIRVTFSIGVASINDVVADGGPNELIALADSRLYRAKAAGKNRVCAEGP